MHHFLIILLEFGGDARDYRYPALATYAESAWKDHLRALAVIKEDLMVLILEYFEFGVYPSDYGGRESTSLSGRVKPCSHHLPSR